mgnify:CR=1 FL=1
MKNKLLSLKKEEKAIHEPKTADCRVTKRLLLNLCLLLNWNNWLWIEEASWKYIFTASIWIVILKLDYFIYYLGMYIIFPIITLWQILISTNRMTYANCTNLSQYKFMHSVCFIIWNSGCIYFIYHIFIFCFLHECLYILNSYLKLSLLMVDVVCG